MLLYGAAAWALMRTERERLDAFEMGRLRSIAGDKRDEFGPKRRNSRKAVSTAILFEVEKR